MDDQQAAPAAAAEDQDDDLLTIPEAADLLKVSTVTISRWRREGRLPAFKVGPRAVRIRRGDLLRVFAPYRGPLTTLDDAPGGVATAAHDGNGSGLVGVAPPRTQGPAASLARRTAAVTRAVTLRETILARRDGQFLPPAGEELTKTREKRGKRRG